jgi:hypothetical protein
MTLLFAAVHESGFGTFETSRGYARSSGFGAQADVLRKASRGSF